MKADSNLQEWRGSHFSFFFLLSICLCCVLVNQSRAAAAESDYGKLVQEASSYDPAGSREHLLKLESAVAAAASQPSLKSQLARELAKGVVASGATLDAKKFFCWQLSVVGSEEQVPLLAGLLQDAQMSYYARLALERIPGDEAFESLRRGLSSAPADQRPAIVASLAARADARIIPDLVKASQASDARTAGAAITALGQLGGIESVRQLIRLEATIAEPLRPHVSQAIIEAASRLNLKDHSSELAPVFERLVEPAAAPVIRVGAFQLLLETLGEKAQPRIISALKGQDSALRQAALQSLKRADDATLAGVLTNLNQMNSEAQSGLLNIAVERRATGVTPALQNLLRSPDPALRIAAIRALGTLGDESVIAPLIARLPEADPAEQTAVGEALATLSGSRVDKALIESTANAAPQTQAILLRSLRIRGSTDAIPLFTSSASADAVAVRREGIRALGQLADVHSCKALIPLIASADPQIASEIESALAGICRRHGDVSPLVQALEDAAPLTRVGVMNALAAVGGMEAVRAIERQLEVNDPEVRTTSVRLMADWPDAAPLKSLTAVATGSADARNRTLALRGVARLAPIADAASQREVVQSIGKALAASRQEDQRALLATLGSITNLSSLSLAAGYVNTDGLSKESRTAVYRILEGLNKAEAAEVRPIINRLKESNISAEEAARLQWLEVKFGAMKNLSLGATAVNLTALQSDGQGGAPAAAIDGDPQTYWDEVDNQKLYAMRVDLKQPSKVAFLRITGWQHQNHAPRDFEVIGDGQSLKTVTGARYVENTLLIALPATMVRSLELRITASYGPSPAIRELEIYGQN